MYSTGTRGVEAFLKKTAIAYGRDPSKKVKFWWYAIAVFFKNASTPRVLVQYRYCVIASHLRPKKAKLPSCAAGLPGLPTLEF